MNRKQPPLMSKLPLDRFLVACLPLINLKWHSKKAKNTNVQHLHHKIRSLLLNYPSVDTTDYSLTRLSPTKYRRSSEELEQA